MFKQHLKSKKWYDSVDIKSVILHVDLGTYAGTVATLNGTKSASYHEYIKKDGSIVQFVPLNKGAWHSGKVHKPTQKAKALYGSVNPNRLSYGLCYEGRAVDKNGRVTSNWNLAVDGQKANDKQVTAAAKRLIDLGHDTLPTFAHKEVASYKPASVLDFKRRVISLIQKSTVIETPETCAVEKSKVNFLIQLLKKLRPSS